MARSGKACKVVGRISVAIKINDAQNTIPTIVNVVEIPPNVARANDTRVVGLEI